MHLIPTIVTPLHFMANDGNKKGGKDPLKTGGAAVWRPVVKRYRHMAGRENGSCGGSPFTVKELWQKSNW